MNAPIVLDRTPVAIRGEELHPVRWRRKQWAVTSSGIEALDGTYAIEADGSPTWARRRGWTPRNSGRPG